MSKETENLKLFKYDSETDDFNTTTFNVQQALNDNWDKIDLGYEDTTKEIVELKLTDEEIKKDLTKINLLTQISDIERYNKDDDGIYRTVAYRTPTVDKKGKLTMLSELSVLGEHKYQKITLYDENEGAYKIYHFELIYKDDDFVERKVIKIV
ncbi:TPA: hypothetical protein N2D60_003571 [Clostridium botulinum]|nr:hypothetical protein [Clostridium botulinum]